MDTADVILAILDGCCDRFAFPMLDNGYVYLAACRLTLFRSSEDWAMVFEIFGFSPRQGLPSTSISTFASRLHARDPGETFVTGEAYANYLAAHAHDATRFVHPVAEGEWQDEECGEFVARGAESVIVRGETVCLPTREEYRDAGVQLESPDHVNVYELCRFLAERRRSRVLATPDELRLSIRPEMTQVLQLDAWHHPNVVDDADRPSGSETFRQLARVLETGDIVHYRPTLSPNTHWSNWPDGGTL